MWRKSASPEFFAALRTLTPDQRWTIQQAAGRLEKDPRDALHSPVVLGNNVREIAVAGLWLRYRLEATSKTIVFLGVSR
jgi:hypothetical protein